MGLDMYLKAKLYVSGYEFSDKDSKKVYYDLVNNFTMQEFISKHCPSAEISFTVGYWRKANAIHNYFVNEIGSGKDDCSPIYVARGNLVDLGLLCKSILACKGDIDFAEKNLPSLSGFFFGDTDYDDDYYQDLEDTVEIIGRCLELDSNEWSFEYQASW